MDGTLGAAVQAPVRERGGAAIAGALEQRIGYAFTNRDLLLTALIHPSSAASSASNYERFEFLGDRVLGLVVAEMLIQDFPRASEGELSRRSSDLVRAETCAEVALEIDLASAVRVSGIKADVMRRTTNILGDACEALIAAIFLDGGLDAARQFIAAHWRRRLLAWQGLRKDAKTSLQEWTASKGLGAPTYAIVGRSGPEHAPRFEVEVTVTGSAPHRGAGRTRREAEQDAAAAALIGQGVWNADGPAA